jgi:hypothetical protein
MREREREREREKESGVRDCGLTMFCYKPTET